MFFRRAADEALVPDPSPAVFLLAVGVPFGAVVAPVLFGFALEGFAFELLPCDLPFVAGSVSAASAAPGESDLNKPLTPVGFAAGVSVLLASMTVVLLAPAAPSQPPALSSPFFLIGPAAVPMVRYTTSC